MIINEEVKSVIQGSPFLSLVTVNTDNTPHPIVTGRGEIDGDAIVFGIYRMDITQKNLLVNKSAWVVAATQTGGPKGYRLTGTAEVKGKQVVFSPSKVEALI